MGTHVRKKVAPKDLHVNETHKAPKVSNTRGTAAIAHWDVPDCGNSEFFINLKSNGHLDGVRWLESIAEVADDASRGRRQNCGGDRGKQAVRPVKTVRLA